MTLLCGCEAQMSPGGGSQFMPGSPVTHGIPITPPLSMAVQGGSVCRCVVRVEGSRRSGIWGAALHLMKHFCCYRSAGLLIPLLNALTAGLNSNRKGKCWLNWRDPGFV